MNKPIALIIAAMVLLMASVTVSLMYTESIDETGQNLENVENSKCDYQIDQAEEMSDLSPTCQQQVEQSSFVLQKVENSNCLTQTC